MKIAIIYASAGKGHQSVAKAVFDVIRKEKGYEVSVFDALDYTNLIFKTFYSKGYIFLVVYFPWLWFIFYYFTDFWGSIRLLSFLSGRLNTYINCRPLINYLCKERFDIIITTQFFANEVVSILKASKRIDSKLICVVTDYGVHSFWASKAVDRYIVGMEITKKQLVNKGIDENKIDILGIPVSKDFFKPVDKGNVCQKLRIKPGIFTVLIMTATMGIGPMREIVECLKNNFQLLVICGRNKKLYDYLIQIKSDLIKPYIFVEHIYELLDICDVIITKPGGATTSEALIKNLPMIFISPIAGQETNNAKILVNYGAAIYPKNITQIRQTLLDLKNNPEKLIQIKNRIKELAIYRPENILKTL